MNTNKMLLPTADRVDILRNFLRTVRAVGRGDPAVAEATAKLEGIVITKGTKCPEYDAQLGLIKKLVDAFDSAKPKR